MDLSTGLSIRCLPMKPLDLVYRQWTESGTSNDLLITCIAARSFFGVLCNCIFSQIYFLNLMLIFTFIQSRWQLKCCDWFHSKFEWYTKLSIETVINYEDYPENRDNNKIFGEYFATKWKSSRAEKYRSRSLQILFICLTALDTKTPLNLKRI